MDSPHPHLAVGHQSSPRQSDPNTRLRAGLACWVPVAMAQVTHYSLWMFVVQKYLTPRYTQYVDCTRYDMIVSYCTSTHPMQRHFSGYNSGTWSDPTVGHPHPRHSVSSTELAVVPHGHPSRVQTHGTNKS